MKIIDTAIATAEHASHMPPVSVILQSLYLLKYNQRAPSRLRPEIKVEIAPADHLHALSP